MSLLYKKSRATLTPNPRNNFVDQLNKSEKSNKTKEETISSDTTKGVQVRCKAYNLLAIQLLKMKKTP